MRTPEEYNLHTLFAPRLKGRPFLESVAVLMTHPVFWGIELMMAAPIVLLSLLACVGTLGMAALPVILVGGLAAVGFPLVYVLFLWLIDVYEREPKRVIVSLFLWGAASGFLSFIGNTVLGAIFGAIAGQEFADFFSAVFGAPVVEELFKAVGLVIIAGHHELEDTFDGMLYGFSVGMGFAAVENFLYFTVNVVPDGTEVTPMYWLFFVAYRSVLCALGHGSFTATTGALMGFVRNRPWGRNLAQLAAAFSVVLAIIMHGVFNFSAVFQSVISVHLFQEPLVPLFHGPLVALYAGFWFFVATPLSLMETKRRVARLKAATVSFV